MLAAISWFWLPGTVVTQISLSGSNSVLPKLSAILLPTVLGGGFSLAILLSPKEAENHKKSLLISAIGILIFVIMLIANL